MINEKPLTRFVPFVLFAFLFSCQSGSSQNVLDPIAVKQKLEQKTDAALIDVRTLKEFSDGHIAGAMNIDFEGATFEERISKLDTAKTYFVYCMSGSRSHKAAEYMRHSGFKNIYEMRGGIERWKKEGFPVEKGQ